MLWYAGEYRYYISISVYIYIYIYTHIHYIYRERERERERDPSPPSATVRDAALRRGLRTDAGVRFVDWRSKGSLNHRLPDGVRTNIVFAEVPQYTILMA